MKLIVLHGPSSSGKTTVVKMLFELIKFDEFKITTKNRFWKEVLVVVEKKGHFVGLLSKGNLLQPLSKEISYLMQEQRCEIIVFVANIKNPNIQSFVTSFADFGWEIEYVDIQYEFFSRDKLMQNVLNQRAARKLLQIINSAINQIEPTYLA